LPPLRDRREDIPLLVDHFAKTVAQQNDWRPRPITDEAYAELQRYPWPGNVRELRNVVERLLLLAESEVDAPTVRMALPGEPPAAASLPAASGTLSERMQAHERAEILSELQRHGHRMTDTARALGLERSHLYKKCQQLGIDHKEKT